LERELGDRGRAAIDQAPLRVPCHQMTPTGLAPLPVGPLVCVVFLDLVLSLGHRNRLGLPKRERVDGAGGPTPARLAMAVAGALGFPRDFDGDRAAVALPPVGLVTHELSPFEVWSECSTRAVSRNSRLGRDEVRRSGSTNCDRL